MEAKIESRVYRVEAFIIPKANCAATSNLDINEIDDVKFANKLKFRTSQIIERLDEENQDLLNKSNNAENSQHSPSTQVDSESLESTENLNVSDSSSKKDSINSFNEYQEEPDFETLIKSPELLESYSNQLEKDNSSSDRTGNFSGLKKCLADFMEEEKEKIKKESFIIKTEEKESNLEFNENFNKSSVKEIESISIIDEIQEKTILAIETEENKSQGKENEEKKVQEEEIEKKIDENEVGEKVQKNKFEESRVTKFTYSHKPLPKVEEPIFDEPFVGNLNRNPKNFRHTLDLEYVQSALLNVKTQGNNRTILKHPKRCNSLKSIDEGVEIVDTNFEDICYHGHKNGCTVAVQKPEDVSQEIFKENWMHRLETLRQREALLRDKEIALQSRERLLFKKEKELRILERMVKDKMKQAELYLKRCKNSQSLENVFDEKNTDSRSSNGSGGSKAGFVLNVANTDKRVPFVGEGLWLKAPELRYDVPKENLKNVPPLRNSFATIPSDVKYGSKFSAYSSLRCKPRPKMSYDDLDSTLSADVGDASFIVTSKKFDPVVFKKPAAFSRSASERRPKTEYRNIISKEKCLKEKYAEFEESKILKKVSENIFVSQDKDTKFQDYGIIDKNVDSLNPRLVRSDEEEKKYGYLNLEVDGKSKRKSSKALKNRPISWSAETDDWLQKKREAFNSVNKTCVNKCDKENLELNRKAVKQSTTKKKSGKGKKFSIFR